MCDSNYNDSYTKLLIDSGASYSLITNKSLFTTFTPWHNTPHQVTLADGKTQTPILGSGSISAFIHTGHHITMHNCLYAPSLSTSLLSSKDFSRNKGHSIHTANAKTVITFPLFSIYTDDKPNSNLIYLNLFHSNPTAHNIEFQENPNEPPSSPDSTQPSISEPNQPPSIQHKTIDPPTPLSFSDNPQDPDFLLSQPKPSPKILPHWLKPKTNVAFRDKNGIIHRGS